MVLPEGKVWSCLIHTAVCWTLKDGRVHVEVSGNKHKIWDIRDGHGTTLVLYDGGNDVDKGEEDDVCSVDFRSRGLPSTTIGNCLGDRNQL